MLTVLQCRRKDLQSQFGNGNGLQVHDCTTRTCKYSIAGDRGMHNTDHIITMYTNEALKCGRYILWYTHSYLLMYLLYFKMYMHRLEKAIKGMTEVSIFLQRNAICKFCKHIGG